MQSNKNVIEELKHHYVHSIMASVCNKLKMMAQDILVEQAEITQELLLLFE